MGVNTKPKSINGVLIASKPKEFINYSKWVILVTVNMGFLDFFENWWIFFTALGMPNQVVVVAEDDEVFKVLSAQKYENKIRLERSKIISHAAS